MHIQFHQQREQRNQQPLQQQNNPFQQQSFQQRPLFSQFQQTNNKIQKASENLHIQVPQLRYHQYQQQQLQPVDITRAAPNTGYGQRERHNDSKLKKHASIGHTAALIQQQLMQDQQLSPYINSIKKFSIITDKQYGKSRTTTGVSPFRSHQQHQSRQHYRKQANSNQSPPFFYEPESFMASSHQNENSTNYEEPVTALLKGPRLSYHDANPTEIIIPGIDLSVSSPEPANVHNGKERESNQERRSVFTKMTANEELNKRRNSSNSAMSRSQAMLKTKIANPPNVYNPNLDNNHKIDETIVDITEARYAARSPVNVRGSQPESALSQMRIMDQIYTKSLQQPGSVVHHNHKQLYNKIISADGSKSLMMKRFSQSRMANFSKSSKQSKTKVDSTKFRTQSQVVTGEKNSSNRYSTTLAQKRLSSLRNHNIDSRSYQACGRAGTHDKSALADFLKTMLYSQDNSQKMAQQRTISPQAQNPMMFFVSTDNVPVTKQLPHKLYKGIIKTMKRRRMRSHATPIPLVEHVQKNCTQLGGEFELEREQDDDQKQDTPQTQLNSNTNRSPDKQQKPLASQDHLETKHISSGHMTTYESTRGMNTAQPFKPSATNQSELDSKTVIVRRKGSTTVQQLSLKDLEAKFQQECDDLLVSISQNWQTLNAMDLGKIDFNTLDGLNDHVTLDDRLGSDVGSDQWNVYSLASSNEEIPQSFTQAWVQPPNIIASNKLEIGSQQFVQSPTSENASVSVQGFKAPMQLRKGNLSRGIPAPCWQTGVTKPAVKQLSEVSAKALNQLNQPPQPHAHAAGSKLPSTDQDKSALNISVKSLVKGAGNKNSEETYEANPNTALTQSSPFVSPKAIKPMSMLEMIKGPPTILQESPKARPIQKRMEQAQTQKKNRTLVANKADYWIKSRSKPQTGQGVRVVKINNMEYLGDILR